MWTLVRQLPYDNATRTTRLTTPTGRTVTAQQDARGRVTSTQIGNLNATTFTYDPRGRISAVTIGTGPDARSTSWTYDGFDRPATITDGVSGTWLTSFNDANRLASASTPEGETTQIGHDSAGRPSSVTPPGRPAHVFEFTDANQVSKYTPPAVSPPVGSTQYTYDNDRRLKSVTRADGQTISITYDQAGRLSQTSSVDGTIKREYSATTGKLLRHTALDGGTIQYAYDGFLPLSITWAGAVSGVVTRAWDRNFRVVSESVNGGNTVSYTYDDDGLVTGAGAMTVSRDPSTGLITSTAIGTVADTRQYDPFAGRTDFAVNAGANTVVSYHDAFDKAGRISTQTTSADGQTNEYGYAYDPTGRLHAVKKNGVVTATYEYDANGNRTSKATVSGVESGTYDDQDRQLTYGPWAFGYSPNGEMISRTVTATGAVTHYGYDTSGNLRSVMLPDGRLIEYVVDARNRRIGKKVGGTLVKGWLYRDGFAPAAELDGSGNIVTRFVYVTGGRVPSYMTRNGTTYRIVADERGTPRRIVDVSTGAIAQTLEVDEFGVTLADSAPGFQPLGFAGGLYDSDTGLVHFALRDYDPGVGRWTSKDPARFAYGTNFYAYVGNDPVNHADPTGLAPGDKWYGFNNKTFQNWCHRQMKDISDFTREEIEDLWNEWNRLGRPGGEDEQAETGGRQAGLRG